VLEVWGGFRRPFFGYEGKTKALTAKLKAGKSGRKKSSRWGKRENGSYVGTGPRRLKRGNRRKMVSREQDRDRKGQGGTGGGA